MVRALASHQCGPGSNPGVDAICGLSLLLVLSLAPRGFSPGTPVFPSPQKPTFPNSNSTRNQVNQEQLCGCATCNSLFIYLTTLKYKNLFSLTSKILGSFMRVFTVLQKPIELSTGQGFIQWRALSSFLQIWAWRLKVTKKV